MFHVSWHRGWLFALWMCCVGSLSAAQPLQVLFLGDRGHHQPEQRFKQLQTALAARQINMQYTEQMNDLNAKTLAAYDALIVFANITKIEPTQEAALLEYVNSGKAFIPLHCASYCFHNSDKYIALVGAQFKQHGGEVFAVENALPDHPIMRGYGGFKSWDETYVHTKHNDTDRTILEYRVQGMQAAGQKREPWTWVRTHGQGRIFYTAWGHDERTWGNPGFQNLVERGIRWACKQDLKDVPDFVDVTSFVVPQLTPFRTDVKPFEYDDVGPKIPNYVPGNKWGVQGDKMSQMQRPLPPAESIKHFQTPVGFEMQLYASEENFLNKPIAMNWDERGRLWLCETLDYPNELQPVGQGRDRIRICEDTNNDGVADKFTIFAEGLSIPTAILPIRGGVLVQDATRTLFLKDTNGDDKADIVKELVTGWAAGDTHGGVSNFVYGFDNWVWAMQGYNASKPVLADGTKGPEFRMGFFRMKLDDNDVPNVTKIEFIRSTNNNTWGIGFSEEGLLFGSTANHNPSVYMPIANRYYEAVRGWSPELLAPQMADTHLFAKPATDKVRQVDQFGGYTAGAGHALYTAREYPRQYWNRVAFVCEPTAHIVGTFVLDKSGSNFKSYTPFNMVQSRDEWTAPIMAEIGPDGNLWILDWYNFIVQHNPTPAGFKTGKGNAYESDLRDKRHGRIYRLLYNGDSKASAAKPAGTTASVAMNLAKATNEQLVAALSSNNLFWRRHAQRLLIERRANDAVPGLQKLLDNQTVDALGLNVGAIHALATLSGLGKLDAATIEKGLKHPSAAVRRMTLTVMPVAPSTAQQILAAKSTTDREPLVQLAAILCLAEQEPASEIGQHLATLARDATLLKDRWLREAVTCAAAKHAAFFLPGISPAQKTFKAASFQAPAPLSPEALTMITVVSEHWARGKPNVAEFQALLKSLQTSTPEQLSAVVQGLARGWSKTHKLELDAATEQSLIALLEQAPAATKGELLRLAMAAGSKALSNQTAALSKAWLTSIANSKASPSERGKAARELMSLMPDEPSATQTILDQITPQAPPELIGELLAALESSASDKLGQSLTNKAGALSPANKSAVIRLLLSRPNTTNDLLNAIEKRELLLSDLRLDQQTALGAHPDKKLAARAKKLLAAGGGLPSPDREAVIKDYHSVTETKGDPVKGKLVFTSICAKCHKHGGEGNAIGPDLTGMNVHPKHELLTQIMDPSRSVESNYRNYMVELTNGKVLNGLLAAESLTSIELIDAEAKRIPIQREDIETLNASTKSLMPEGFEKQISKEQMTDLLEFLAQRGKYVPLPLNKAATVVSTIGMFHDKEVRSETIVLSDWKPRTIEGVPFQLIDPNGDKVNNMILLNGPNGKVPPTMPKSVSVPCNGPAKAIHLLSGVSGWGALGDAPKGISMIVRLKYQDGETEDHELRDGVHFADYIRRIEVPGSKFAINANGKQIRYLSINPKRNSVIKEIEFIKGSDNTAPVVAAVTVESP